MRPVAHLPFRPSALWLPSWQKPPQVYIEDLPKHRATCEAVLRDPLPLCARTYAFLLPKDATHKDVRILFLALASDAAADARAGFIPYASADSARARVAHFHTCANVPKFLARLQLPFSKTWPAFDVRARGARVVVVKDAPCRVGHASLTSDWMAERYVAIRFGERPFVHSTSAESARTRPALQWMYLDDLLLMSKYLKGGSLLDSLSQPAADVTLLNAESVRPDCGRVSSPKRMVSLRGHCHME